MYDGVPMIIPVFVRFVPLPSPIFEMPKSSTVAVGAVMSPVKNTFSGFMSRWTTPFS